MARWLFILGPAVLFGGLFALIEPWAGAVFFLAFAGLGWDVTRDPKGRKDPLP